MNSAYSYKPRLGECSLIMSSAYFERYLSKTTTIPEGYRWAIKIPNDLIETNIQIHIRHTNGNDHFLASGAGFGCFFKNIHNGPHI